jgi:ABC-2 type transport system ATP-binding protein
MPVLIAAGAGVRHRRRWLFQDLDVSVQPGEIVAIVGPPGSGRTTVLLALARRFKLSAGRVQGSAALGYVPAVTEPEPVLTVLEHVRERLSLLGRSGRAAGEVPLYGLDPAMMGFQLSPYQRQVLGVVLARLENPQVIALDGVDGGLDGREEDELWGLLAGLSEAGIAVLVTAREVDPARVSTVVRLGGAALADAALSAADGAPLPADATVLPADVPLPQAFPTDEPSPPDDDTSPSAALPDDAAAPAGATSPDVPPAAGPLAGGDASSAVGVGSGSAPGAGPAAGDGPAEQSDKAATGDGPADQEHHSVRDGEKS